MNDRKTNRDLKNIVYDHLKEKLINCEYAPGSMLNEARLTEELGVSRTPIRQALNCIEQEGFIRILPKKGIVVREISLNDVRQIFQVRIEIEPVALKMSGNFLLQEELVNYQKIFQGQDPDNQADFRTDREMHMYIINHCGNRYIIDMMRRVFEENTRIIISTKQHILKFHDAREEHLGILNLLIEREFERAAQEMARHIENCKKAALDFYYRL